MDAVLVERLLESSNAYSNELWGRLAEGRFASEEERSFFERVRSHIDMEAAFPESLREYLSDPAVAPLMDSLFSPGAADGVFINYHHEALNRWVHSHDFFELIYVEHGYATDWVDGVEVELAAGELCVHNPRARHQILRMEQGKDLVINVLLPVDLFQRVFYSLLMENEELSRFFRCYMVSSDTNANYMAFHDTTPRVDAIMELLVEEFLRKGGASRIIMESTLVVLFGELMRSYDADPFMRDLVAYISDNLDNASLDGAARYLGYHRNYLPALVRKHAGRTFWELVTDLRVQKASDLLLFSDASIERIAHAVGYKSPVSFYEHFVERYEMRPAEYRRAFGRTGG